ncbi:DoxX family protein [Roseomonas sp. CAU 1739]|uniref:DoxX family protein n=1 Tax=Roseomonas sp. CAU 1739 TaxID=3140364 RepID=UPI00325AA9D0
MPSLDRWAPYALGLLRIVAAVIFFEHGTQKLLGFPDRAGGAGGPALLSMYGVAGLLEIIGGALLAIGLFVRPTALVLSGFMASAYWISHAPRSIFPVLNGGDAAILYCFLFLYLVFAGGGAFALDNRRT